MHDSNILNTFCITFIWLATNSLYKSSVTTLKKLQNQRNCFLNLKLLEIIIKKKHVNLCYKSENHSKLGI